MDRVGAYALLAAELERWRSMSWQTLVGAAGESPVVTSTMADGETIEIETRVRWVDHRQRSLRIEATAYGPRHWNLERLEEAIVVKAQDDEDAHDSGSS